MVLRVVGRAVQARPGMGVSQRVAVLAATSGLRDAAPAGGRFARMRVARTLIGTARSALEVATVTGPQVALGRAGYKVIGGYPLNQEQKQAHRRAVLAGNAALVAAGVLAQRAAIHALEPGVVSDLSRALGRDLAVSATAGLILVGTDYYFGQSAADRPHQRAIALALGGALATAQSLALRRAAHALTLSRPVHTWDVPVLGVPGIAAVRVPVPRSGAAGLPRIVR